MLTLGKKIIKEIKTLYYWVFYKPEINLSLSQLNLEIMSPNILLIAEVPCLKFIS